MPCRSGRKGIGGGRRWTGKAVGEMPGTGAGTR